MNREIKFRAWDKKNKRMFDVCEIRFYPSSMVWDSDRLIGIQDFELMQYTGLKDKNGKEIYEGDYIAEDETVMSDMGEDKPNYIEKRIEPRFVCANKEVIERRYGRKVSVVRWDSKSCGFEPFSDSQTNCGHCGGALAPSNVEVIGNIYENSELLPTKTLDV